MAGGELIGLAHVHDQYLLPRVHAFLGLCRLDGAVLGLARRFLLAGLLGALKIIRAQVAVTARVFDQVVLVVVLRLPKSGKRGNLHLEISVPGLLLLGQCLDDLAVLLVLKINTGLVLGAHIVALAVFHRRVNGGEKQLYQLRQGDHSRVVGDLDRLPVAGGAGDHRPVIRVVHGAVGIAAGDIHHAGHQRHHVLCAPETAAREIHRRGSLFLGRGRCGFEKRRIDGKNRRQYK